MGVTSSAINDFTNESLTTWQKWATFGADVGYNIVKTGLCIVAGNLITKGSLALGISIGSAAISSVGFLGVAIITSGVLILGVIAGTILIEVLSNVADNWWESFKKGLFN